MAAIITNKFRINNAEQFVESFSETAATTYYLFVGRAHSWASDADVQGNTINEGTDASPPTPNDDVASEFYNYDDMLGAKIIASTDVSHCIPRRNWTTGTTYDKYEHNISSSNTANSGATNLFDSTFVVMNSSYAVYKVIDKAYLSDYPSFPNKFQLRIVGMILGFFIAALLSIFMYFFRNRN